MQSRVLLTRRADGCNWWTHVGSHLGTHDPRLTRKSGKARIDAILLISSGEQTLRLTNALSRSQDEQTTGLQRKVTHVQNPLLQTGLKVNQRIAQRQQIYLRERGVLSNVVLSKDDGLA